MIVSLWKEMIIIDMNKKVVVVTGVASGIGKSVSEKYIKKGFLVCGIDIIHIGLSGKVDGYVCDVSDEDAVKHVFSKIREKYDNINYVINCAGIFFDKERFLIEDMQMSEWESVYKTNLSSCMIVTKYSIPLLKNAKGDKAIVNVSSDQAIFPRKKNSAYSVTKAGIENFTRACSVELLENHIRANCILPASVRSDFVRKIVKNKAELEEIYERENEKMPLGVIEPNEVAELVYFLGSEKSSKITGQAVLMDSGLYCGG